MLTVQWEHAQALNAPRYASAEWDSAVELHILLITTPGVTRVVTRSFQGEVLRETINGKDLLDKLSE